MDIRLNGQYKEQYSECENNDKKNQKGIKGGESRNLYITDTSERLEISDLFFFKSCHS